MLWFLSIECYITLQIHPPDMKSRRESQPPLNNKDKGTCAASNEVNYAQADNTPIFQSYSWFEL